MKRLNLIAIVAVAVLALAACKSKEKTDEYIPGIGPGDTASVLGSERTANSGTIVGSWEGSEEIDLADVSGKTRILYVFNDDGTMTFERNATGKAPVETDELGTMLIGTKFRYEVPGTWNVDGDAVVIKYDTSKMKVELKEVTVLESTLSKGMKAMVEEELQKPENLAPMEADLTKELKSDHDEDERLINIELNGNELSCSREGNPLQLSLSRVQ